MNRMTRTDVVERIERAELELGALRLQLEQMGDDVERRIGKIGNHYGNLLLRKTPESGWEWSIRDYDGCDWEPIPDYLAKALIAFSEKKKDNA